MTGATNDSFHPGERPPCVTDLLLLHGLTYDHRTWDPVRAALAPGHRIIAPDLPGHGTAPRRASYELSEIVEVIHAQAEAAGLVEPVVAGHSLGAVIATAYAAAHPVSRVVNVDQVLLIGPFGTAVREAAPRVSPPGARVGVAVWPPAGAPAPPRRGWATTGSPPARGRAPRA